MQVSANKGHSSNRTLIHGVITDGCCTCCCNQAVQSSQTPTSQKQQQQQQQQQQQIDAKRRSRSWTPLARKIIASNKTINTAAGTTATAANELAKDATEVRTPATLLCSICVCALSSVVLVMLSQYSWLQQLCIYWPARYSSAVL
jgi:transcription initiation factor TFIID subunit TAF12